MLEFLFILPLAAGLVTFFLPRVIGRGTMVVTALLHLQLCILAWRDALLPAAGPYFQPSAMGLLLLLLTSFIFLLITIHTACRSRDQHLAGEATFTGCMLLFLGTMSMVTLADHPIVLWVAIEATTLVSAPLIFLQRTRDALEATWKYVLLCSVGIALALLGCFFISLSADTALVDSIVTFTSLNEAATRLDPLWLKVGFVFILIGFGTKVGLAPMHTWLPDAHSEAPSPASALLSGALLNCAFIGIYQVHTVMYQAGLGDFSGRLLIGFGLLSMLVAGIFIMKQNDYKRLLAYSSIEHMGVIAFGIGVGGFALYGAVLHLIHHSLIKSSLFLSAGNILHSFGSKAVDRIGNLAGVLPRTFLSFFAGFIALAGLPPFGIFISELLILFGAIKAGLVLPALIFAVALLLVMAGATRIINDMCFADQGEPPLRQDSLASTLPPGLLLLTSVVLCIWLPAPIQQRIIETIALIGGMFHG